MHDAHIVRLFPQMKITRKASDAAENLQLYRVVRFFHPRSSCTTTHISADVQRIILNASCMTISGGRTKQLDIFYGVTGFTSDFLCFIVGEHIQFFHGVLQSRAKQCENRQRPKPLCLSEIQIKIRPSLDTLEVPFSPKLLLSKIYNENVPMTFFQRGTLC